MTADSFLDTPWARLLAGLVALAAVFAIAVVWMTFMRIDPAGVALPHVGAPDMAPDPAFIACRDERLGQIDAMRRDGVITEIQREQFAASAIEICAGRLKDPTR